MSMISTQTAPGSYSLSGIIRGYNRQMSESLERIATGLRVNKPSDDIMSFFRAKELNSLANSTKTVASGIEEHIGRMETAEGALTTISDIIEQMAELAKEASASDNAAERKSLGSEYDQLRNSISTIVNTTRYKGELILNGTFDTDSQVSGTAGKGISVQVGENINDLFTYELLDTRVDADGDVGDDTYSGLNIGTSFAETQWAVDKANAATSYADLTQNDSGLIRLRRNATRVKSNLTVLNGARTNMETKQSNYLAASSALAGVDQAEETSRYTSLQIQQQAAASFLAQSNVAYSSVMGMLTGFGR